MLSRASSIPACFPSLQHIYLRYFSIFSPRVVCLPIERASGCFLAKVLYELHASRIVAKRADRRVVTDEASLTTLRDLCKLVPLYRKDQVSLVHTMKAYGGIEV
jgi:hypothetical protein